MNRKHRRGQAALEFLTTYGWAFLVILVMIGALAYFGVINPNRFLPEKCLFQQEFHCKDYQVKYVDSGEADVNFYITNNLGSGITIPVDGVSINHTGTTGGEECPDTLLSLGAGMTGEITCPGVPGSYIDGEKTKFTVTIRYNTTTGKYTRIMNGDIFATAHN
ncbi:hypothetical protein GOV07_01395 [Candidatus Woesearchaeota archaeon]|nr:hypothetical protein [Candidatus Woesearchaeota archaeon]